VKKIMAFAVIFNLGIIFLLVLHISRPTVALGRGWTWELPIAAEVNCTERGCTCTVTSKSGHVSFERQPNGTITPIVR
jgi:hypothetical protein